MRSSSASPRRGHRDQLPAHSHGDWFCLQMHEHMHRPKEGIISLSIWHC